MSLFQAMSTATSGLLTTQTAMDVIGNNMANTNTTAYKVSDYSFSTLLQNTLAAGTVSSGSIGSTNALQVGLGVQLASVTADFTQGGLSSTSNSLDFALSGRGFFVLSDGDSYCYTRDGNFTLGDDSALLSSTGLYVQGVTADVDGTIPDSATIGNIYIELGSVDPAQETTEVSLTGNLNSGSGVAASTKIVSGSPDSSVEDYIGTDYTTSGTSIDSADYWNALVYSEDTASYINGGSVETSGAFGIAEDYDGDGVNSYSSASLDTDLAALYYYNGSTWTQLFSGIEDGDTFSTSWQKDGVTYSSSFTYTEGSTTLQDYLTFLTGDVDRTANISTIEDVEGSENTDTTGGAMGTICVAGDVSTEEGGTSDYSAAVETAGAFTRTLTDEVDGDNDGVYDDFLGISIVSNLGDSNAISDIQITYDSVTYDDVFSADADYGTESGASSATTTVTAYDSLGNTHDVSVTLTLVSQSDSTSTYRWVATSTDDTNDTWALDPDTGELTTNSVVGTGTISFDSSGTYLSGSQTSETGGIYLDLEDSGVSTPISLAVVDGSTQTQGFDLSGLSFSSLETSITQSANNGNAAGTLESFAVTEEGIIQGTYSNGITKNLAQLVVAQFTNEAGLTADSNNQYTASVSSGDAQIGFIDGESTAVYNNMLEDSNVDTSTEMTDLITIQRSFQFDSKIVTACDEMLQTLINMK